MISVFIMCISNVYSQISCEELIFQHYPSKGKERKFIVLPSGVDERILVHSNWVA